MTFTRSGNDISQTNEAEQDITTIATHTDGIQITVTAHDYFVSDWLHITGTTDYNGDFEVLSIINVNNFTIGRTFTTNQTGTVARGDNTFSSLSAFSGIDIVDVGVTDFPYSIYDSTNMTLGINGSLRHDQFEEQLLVDQIDINSGGIYNCGIIKEEPEDATIPFDTSVPLLAVHIKNRGVHPQNDPGFKINSGGTLILNGAMILMHSGFRGYYTTDNNQATVRINNGYIYIEGSATQNSLPYKVRFDGTDVEINGLQQYGGAFTTERVLTQFNGYEPTHYEGWQVPIQSDQTIFFTAEGYRGGGRGNIQDIRWTETKMRLKNCSTGPNIIGGSHQTQNGVMENTQEFKLKIRDLNNNNIENARYFLRDINNGNRANYTQNSNNDNYTDDRTYTGVSDTNGETDSTEVLTSVSVDNGSNNDGSTRDHRFSNDVLAITDIPVWSYEHQYTPVLGIQLVDENPLTFSAKMAEDTAVTGTSTQAAAHDVVIASNGLSISVNESMTLDDLYDRLKYAKIQSATIEQPTISTQFCTAVGTVRDFGSLDITIDSDVILSAGVKGQSLETTGTITINSGASITAPYKDSVGVSFQLSTTANAIAYIEEIVGSVITIHEETANSSGLISLVVNEDAMLKITCKRFGYLYQKRTHEISDSLTLSLTLQKDVHVDSGQDISTYVDEDVTSNTNKIYFDYNSTKSHMVFGIINLKSKPAKSKALFDQSNYDI